MEVKPGYKQTEVGVIPAEWEVVPFGEFLDFKNGVNADKSDYGRGVPFANVLEVITKTHLSTMDVPGRVTLSSESIQTYSVHRGDILFNRTSETESEIGLASTYTGDDPIVFGGFVIRGRPKNGRIDGTFAGYALRAPAVRKQIVAKGQGAIRSNIGQGDLAKVVAVLPPILEQRAIAKALSDVDALLDALDQLIAKKRDLKQAAMQQLLTGKTRLPGFHGEWAVKTFGELFTFSGGYSASRDQLSTDGYCYLHYGDIHTSLKIVVDVRAEYSSIPKLNIPLKRVSSSALLQDGDVVFVDASEDDEGTSKHVVVVNKENLPFISGLHTIVAKGRTDELTHEFRRHCFQTRAVKQQFKFYAVGTKVSGISKTHIPKLTLPVPPLPEQTAIAEVLLDMDAELVALARRRDQTRALKQGMMQELLTGRIRLPV